MASVEVVRCRGLRRALLLWRAGFPFRGKFVFQRRNASFPEEEWGALAKKSAEKPSARAFVAPYAVSKLLPIFAYKKTP